jgi:hypothetical protein
MSKIVIRDNKEALEKFEKEIVEVFPEYILEKLAKEIYKYHLQKTMSLE